MSEESLEERNRLLDLVHKETTPENVRAYIKAEEQLDAQNNPLNFRRHYKESIKELVFRKFMENE